MILNTVYQKAQHMKKHFTIFLFIFFLTNILHAQQNSYQELTYSFIPDKNLQFTSRSGNSYNLLRISEVIKNNRKGFYDGSIKILIDSYYGSSKRESECLKNAHTLGEMVRNEIMQRDNLPTDQFEMNYFTKYDEEGKNAVIVRISVPQKRTRNSPKVVQTAEPVIIIPVEETVQSVNVYPTDTKEIFILNGRDMVENYFSVGLNVGIPFYWGDMLSLASLKKYVGYDIGIQGSYHFNSTFAASLSVDYGINKAGARAGSLYYDLLPDGIKVDSPETGALPYHSLYSKISVVNFGLSFDFNPFGLFFPGGDIKGFSAIISPTVYGQLFHADIYKRDGGEKFSNGETKPKGLSFGLGGSLSLRYNIWDNMDIQIKNSMIWITNNKFDGIDTPSDKSKKNAMWVPQIGFIWNFK